MSKEHTRASVILPVSSPTWITRSDLYFMVERDHLTANLRLIGVSRSLVGIWKIDTNFAEIRVSPMVFVSNRAFALCPLTVM